MERKAIRDEIIEEKSHQYVSPHHRAMSAEFIDRQPIGPESVVRPTPTHDGKKHTTERERERETERERLNLFNLLLQQRMHTGCVNVQVN
jgi:hypothetical protein